LTLLISLPFIPPISPPLSLSTLFPYTTLFRSIPPAMTATITRPARALFSLPTGFAKAAPVRFSARLAREPNTALAARLVKSINRSEEHTSELQSRFDLVCRLLLEKKNNRQIYT